MSYATDYDRSAMASAAEFPQPHPSPVHDEHATVATRPLTAAVASQSYLVRVGLAEVLREMTGVTVAGSYGDGDALLRGSLAERVDVVVTDLDLPPTGPGEGLRIARALAREAPGVGVVVLSEHDRGPSALALFAEDVAGRAYLVKQRLRRGPDLETAVRAVAAGESWFDPSTASQLIHRTGLAADSPLAALSPRELQVLAAIAEGKSNGAIADELVLTKRAVEKHVGSIFGKLGLPAESLVSRRVSAVLVYLGQTAR